MREGNLVEALSYYLDRYLGESSSLAHKAEFDFGPHSREYYFEKFCDSLEIAHETFETLICKVGKNFGGYEEKIFGWEDDLEYLENTFEDLREEFG